MADDKVFYWLKLKEDFFEDDTIQWLEEQENGKEYTLFYLKLCLKSLNLDGKIIRIVGEKLIPYDKKALAKLTNTDIDTVSVSMNLFVQIGLIDILDTGEIYMKQVKEMVGSKTEGALRKAKYRKGLEEGERDIVPLLSQECPTEYREKRKENTDKRTEKELQQLGYLIKNQSRENGEFAKVDWLLYDEPGNVDIQAFLPQTEKRSTDNPPTENQPLLSTNVTKDLNNKEASSIPYSKIIAYLNEQTGKSYKAVGKNNALIKARWNEGYSLEEFKRVIDNKVATWKGVTFQDGTLGDRYLQPTTLFGGKFDGYLNETQPKKASKTIDEEMGGNDKYQQYLERKGLAAANNQQPTA